MKWILQLSRVSLSGGVRRLQMRPVQCCKDRNFRGCGALVQAHSNGGYSLCDDPFYQGRVNGIVATARPVCGIWYRSKGQPNVDAHGLASALARYWSCLAAHLRDQRSFRDIPYPIRESFSLINVASRGAW